MTPVSQNAPEVNYPYFSDQDSSTLSIYSTSFQFQPESPGPPSQQLHSPDVTYFMDETDAVSQSTTGFLSHYDDYYSKVIIEL